MGLFLVLFWCARLVGGAFPDHSRFGEINSRLGQNKFPFGPLRELPGEGLICLAVFGAETALSGTIEQIPAYFPLVREFAHRGTDAASHSADLIEPAR